MQGFESGFLILVLFSNALILGTRIPADKSSRKYEAGIGEITRHLSATVNPPWLSGESVGYCTEKTVDQALIFTKSDDGIVRLDRHDSYRDILFMTSSWDTLVDSKMLDLSGCSSTSLTTRSRQTAFPEYSSTASPSRCIKWMSQRAWLNSVENKCL
jgi:hypothetical protein